MLDRLNSLLEPNGFLLLTESGEERLVRPHEDFRVFFTMTTGVAPVSGPGTANGSLKRLGFM